MTRSRSASPISSRPIRLQKVLAAAGVASRRGAETLLRAGRVRVDGVAAQLGDSADPERSAITVDGVRVYGEEPTYWMLHKPRGVLTTLSDPEGRPTVLDLLPKGGTRVFPVGRLDRDTEGLVLLTNDGALAHALLHPSHGSEREYHVRVQGRVRGETQRVLAGGVELEDGRTAPAGVSSSRYEPRGDTTRFTLILIEGRKRQIRRAMSTLGHPVVGLVRVRMGPLRLGRLPLGAARPLRTGERSALQKFLGEVRFS